MRAKHFLVLLVTASIAGCGSPEPGFFERTMPTTQTAAELAPGITEIDSIPVDELSTDGTVALNKSSPCSSVPNDVVAPAGFTDHHRRRRCTPALTTGKGDNATPEVDIRPPLDRATRPRPGR